MTPRQLNLLLGVTLAVTLFAFAIYAKSGRHDRVSSVDLIGEWENNLPKFAKDQYSTTLSIRGDGTFEKTETNGGQNQVSRTTKFTGEYKIGNEELYGDFIQLFVFDANSLTDSNVGKKHEEAGGWSFMCKYGFTSDGQLMLMDIMGNKSGLKKRSDDIFPSWEFYDRL